METAEKFGNILRDLIKESGMSNVAFYTELEMAKPYFYEILSGKSNPPPSATQFKMVKILNCDKHSARKLFDAAAKERREFPADIAKWVAEDPNAFSYIRNIMPTAQHEEVIL